MKINNNLIYAGEDTSGIRNGKKQSGGLSSGGSINANDLNIKFDPIAAKREEAKKKAMDIIGKAFANESKIDDDLNKRRRHIRELSDENALATKEIKEYEDMRLDLRNRYGIDLDSQEEKDLRLLEKEIDSLRPDSKINLTEDDYKELKRIKEAGLSEYQERSLEIRSYEGPAKESIYQNKLEIQTENAIITAVELERLKSHALLDAQKQAEDILDDASKEIMGMLADEAKEHIDDELEEKIEDSKEKAEEKKELEERIEKARDDKKEKEKISEDILEGVAEMIKTSSELNDAKQEIKDMMSKMKLIEEDIKGAAVDEVF
jgi:chromosome segregation ATPase